MTTKGLALGLFAAVALSAPVQFQPPTNPDYIYKAEKTADGQLKITSQSGIVHFFKIHPSLTLAESLDASTQNTTKNYENVTEIAAQEIAEEKKILQQSEEIPDADKDSSSQSPSSTPSQTTDSVSVEPSTYVTAESISTSSQTTTTTTVSSLNDYIKRKLDSFDIQLKNIVLKLDELLNEIIFSQTVIPFTTTTAITITTQDDEGKRRQEANAANNGAADEMLMINGQLINRRDFEAALMQALYAEYQRQHQQFYQQ